MSGRKPTEAELEALAHGRRDLVPDEIARAAERDDALEAWISRERDASRDASVALKRAAPDLDDLDAMIARAMTHATDEEASVAPSRKSLWTGAALGVAIALASGVASVLASEGPAALARDAWADLTALTRLGVTLGLTLDRLVGAIPGGWAAIAAIGLALFALLALPLRAIAGPWRVRGPASTAAVLALAVLGASTSARAYDVEGTWPEPDARVSVDVERAPLSEALRRALASAELGLAYSLPDDPPVTLHVREAPLREVLEALLADAPARVRHTGHMIVVRPAPERPAPEAVVPTPAEPAVNGAAGRSTPEPSAPQPPLPAQPPTTPQAMPQPPVAPQPPQAMPQPPLPPPPIAAPAAAASPTPQSTGELRDLVTFGGDARVLPEQQVRDVITMGGDAQVAGQVYGNVVTMGGNADVRGTVVGDVVTMGGNIHVREGGRVHGQLNAMGGRVSVDEPPPSSVHVSLGGASRSASQVPRARADERGGWLGEALESAMRYALLFLLGLLFMGVAPGRLAALQGAIVKQPLRVMASGFLGVIAGAVLTVVLVITILGIPAAVVVGLGLFLGAYVGLATTASVVGAALPIPALRGRPVLQLAIGVALLFLTSHVPVIGPLLVVGATLAGLGAVLLTRLGQKPIVPV